MPNRRVIYAIASIPTGFALMFPLAYLFDLLKLPLFNQWALEHGSLVIAWPLLSYLAFRILMAYDVKYLSGPAK
jgi:hypothetical protein